MFTCFCCTLVHAFICPLTVIFQVRAIIVAKESLQEADLERRSKLGCLLNEEVFLCQLHRRAELLNDEFQEKVLKALLGTFQLQDHNQDNLSDASLNLSEEMEPRQGTAFSQTSNMPNETNSGSHHVARASFDPNIDACQEGSHLATPYEKSCPCCIPWPNPCCFDLSLNKQQHVVEPRPQTMRRTSALHHAPRTSRAQSQADTLSTLGDSLEMTLVHCVFHGRQTTVQFHPAPIKTIGRMR